MSIHLFGITGKKACGKTTVARIFRRNNIPVIDVDGLYLDMFKPGNNVHREIIKFFGEDFLTENGNVDLKKLSVSLCKERWIKEFIDDVMEKEIDNFINKLMQTFEFHKMDIAGIESGIISQTIMNNYMSCIILIDSLLQNRIERMKNIVPEKSITNIVCIENDNDWTDYDFMIENNGDMDLLEKNTIKTIKDMLFFIKNN